MINLEKALVKDAKELLKIQKQCFKNYSIKYGDFDSNPYHMTLHRMEFNLKYKFGHYYKVVDFKTEAIIGGIFIFELLASDVSSFDISLLLFCFILFFYTNNLIPIFQINLLVFIPSFQSNTLS